MAKTGGGIRGGRNRSARTGPGFTQPIEGERAAKEYARTSPALEVRYVAVDKETGNEVTNPLVSADAVKKAIPIQEREDKEAGIYIKDSYYIRAINVIKRR